MKRVRVHAVFTWEHPTAEGSENKTVLPNLRSWNAHIEKFISDTVITKYCDIMCFTEIYTHGSNFTEISNNLNGWKDIHFCTEHELVFCFKEQSPKILEEIHVATTRETLALVLDIKGEHNSAYITFTVHLVQFTVS